MKTVRTHVRRKLPVEVFYKKNHLPLIDFSFGGVGVSFDEIAPPEEDSVRLTLIFPYQGENVGWEVNAKVVRVDHKTKFAAFEFIEDDDFQKFTLAFYDEMRSRGMMK